MNDEAFNKAAAAGLTLRRSAFTLHDDILKRKNDECLACVASLYTCGDVRAVAHDKTI
jgi:hypothetical protein